MRKPSRFYFTIRYLPDDADHSLLAGRCISILHGLNTAHSEQQIGVIFPSWSAHSIGNTVGFVSQDKSILSHLHSNSYFKQMAEFKFFDVSEISKEPNNCDEVMFIHNRRIAKMFVGDIRRRLARSKRRAEARGEIFQPKPIVEKEDIGHFHSVFIQSKTSGQDFLLHIQKKKCDAMRLSYDYNGYGFTTNLDHCGSVPDIRIDIR